MKSTHTHSKKYFLKYSISINNARTSADILIANPCFLANNAIFFAGATTILSCPIKCFCPHFQPSSACNTASAKVTKFVPLTINCK